MRTDPRVPEMRHAAEVAVLDAGFFERTAADAVVGAAGETVDAVFGWEGGGGGGFVGRGAGVEACWFGAGLRDVDAAESGRC